MTDELDSAEMPEIKPCRHMERLVHALADESLSGFARWYTQLHMRGCQRCYAALKAIQKLRARLNALRAGECGAIPATLPPNRRAAVEAALDELDRRRE